jgi:hypothetical protein
MLELTTVSAGIKNLIIFKPLVLDVVHFLAASWDLTNAAVVSSCSSKANSSVVLNEEIEMEFVAESAWEVLQGDLTPCVVSNITLVSMMIYYRVSR